MGPPASEVPSGSTTSSPQRRRVFHSGLWPSLVALIALAPVLVGSLGIVAPIAFGVHLVWPGWGAVVPFLVWCALVPLPMTRSPVVRVAYGYREPDDTERERLDTAWSRVLHLAGVPGDRHRLLVVDSAELNACTATGRILGVTAHAARVLTPDRLEAVLAHELGHRLGWHGLLAAVHGWLMLPIRALWWLLRAMWSPVAPMWRRAVAWHRPIGFLLTFLLAVAAIAVSAGAALPAAVAFGGIRVARLFTGTAEHAADAVAVRLGLGTELLATLEHTIETGHNERPSALPMALVRRAERLRKQLAGPTQ